jgi:hypothetical protein
MTPLKSLFAAASLILLAFARSHDGSGEGKVDSLPAYVSQLILVDSFGNKVAIRDSATRKWTIFKCEKALDVLYTVWSNHVCAGPKPTILERLNGMQPFPSPLPDTTKPKYRYFYKVPEISEPEFFRINFVMDSVFSGYGREKGMSEVDKAVAFYYFHKDFLMKKFVRDSVKIETKGGKP